MTVALPRLHHVNRVFARISRSEFILSAPRNTVWIQILLREMDHEVISSKRDSNMSSQLSHRMPTVSAAQAIQDLNSGSGRWISTGLKGLDAALQPNGGSLSLPKASFSGGVSRAKITEIYGPPGVGKTALGLQLATKVLRSGQGVYWVDAAQPLCGKRLNQLLSSSESVSTTTGHLNRFTHLSAPTLAHLIALVSDPNPTYLIDNIGLLVIDSFSALISTAFPRVTENPNTPKAPGVSKPSSRKFPILQYLINTLQKLATTQNIALVVLSQCVTKMRPGKGAVLLPAINATAWEQGIGARIALFRDWGWDDEDGNFVDNVRYAQVLKAEGTSIPTYRLQVVAFTIKTHGLEQLEPPELPSFDKPHPVVQNDPQESILPQKRKLASTELEIPDSDEEDDEDYGWADEDEQELPAAPPQWQGSEDILITRDDQLEAEDEPDGDEEAQRSPSKQNHQTGEEKVEPSVAFYGEIEDSEDELAL